MQDIIVEKYLIKVVRGKAHTDCFVLSGIMRRRRGTSSGRRRRCRRRHEEEEEENDKETKEGEDQCPTLSTRLFVRSR